MKSINPLNAELNPICHLLALLGGATIVVVSRLRVNRLGEFRFSHHVNCRLYIGPVRTKLKLNKFHCSHTNAKFVLNPLNRFGD
jgi:hypothetical protein